MRKAKLAWWKKEDRSHDLMLRALGSEGYAGETMAGCIGYHNHDYIFLIETKDGNYTTIKHPTRKK